MQKPVKRGNSYRIQVRYKDLRDTATRDTARECEQWAATRLLELKAQYSNLITLQEKPPYPFRSLFEKYYLEVGRHKRGYTYIKQQLSAFDRYFGDMTQMSIHDITPQKVTKWRNDRLKEVSSGTVQRQMCLYCSIFNYAKNELFLIAENPFAKVAKPLKPKPRNRLISADEINKILAASNYKSGTTPSTPGQYVAWAFLFAMETAMRRGEIIGVTCNNIYKDYIHLPITKNGDSRDVPLSKEARALLDLVPHKDRVKLIPHNDNSFRLCWQRTLKKTGLSGLIHFHDTRHVAITNFVNKRKLPVEILAKVTGHRDIKTLINTYYNPNASDIAKMMNA
ncbi:tyrosine-type recombinase/integrase [Acinetobacter populi]|uniref:Integrase n=1 Tax=Acinetobacter populi TaxID=1582270 RepID=A0A1Z9Z0Q8_9GAMM|nr:site-specific integrase [Acinetobacter populi]OUY08081.1 integrase [Acinetobacter populi]